MKVYLCGGINGLTDDEAMGWREYVKTQLPEAEHIDPMRRDYRGREDESVNDIVNGDEADILESDVVLANCGRPSWGTAMEIHFAHTQCIDVIAVVPEGQPISPWLRYHATIIARSLDEAISALKVP